MESANEITGKIDESLARNGYERLEMIGVGPWARVYRCRSLETGRDVALKIFDRCAGDPGITPAMDRFWSRMDRDTAGSETKLPGCVRLYAKSGKRGFVISKLQAGSLAGSQRQKPGSDDVRRILTSAIRRLVDHHERARIMHGEIKPSNLFVDERFEIRLGDSRFVPLRGNGLVENARDLEIPDPQASKWSCLEPGDRVPYAVGKYVAPELVNVQFGPVGKWVDQYRLGFSIYEYAMGDTFETLIDGVGPEVIDFELGWLRWQASTTEIPSPQRTLRHLDAPVREVLHRLTRKKVTDRYRHLGQALTLLETGGEGQSRSVSLRESQELDAKNAALPQKRRSANPPGISCRFENVIDDRNEMTLSHIDWLDLPPEPWTWEWVQKHSKKRLTRRRAVLACLGVLALFMFSAGYRDVRAMRMVRIVTQPPDAAVFVDGKLIHGEAPHELVLAAGPHSIQAKHEDFEESSAETFEIPPLPAPLNDQNGTPSSAAHEIRIALRRQQTAVEFQVLGFDRKAIPAQVVVTAVGGESKQESLRAGSDVLEVPANLRIAYRTIVPGYEIETGEFVSQRRLDGRRQTIVLSPAPKPRNVRFRNSQTDAQVIDEQGSVLGACDRTITLEPNPRPYRLTVRKDGFFETKVKPFEVKPGEGELVVHVDELRLIDESGVLEVATTPANVEFMLTRLDVAPGQSFVGKGPKWRSESLPNGSRWVLAARLDRFTRPAETIEISAGTKSVKIEMQMPPEFVLANGMKFRRIPEGTVTDSAERAESPQRDASEPGRFSIDYGSGRFEWFSLVSRGPFFPPAMVRTRPPVFRKEKPVEPLSRTRPAWGIYVCTKETTLRWYREIMGYQPKMLAAHNEDWPVADISFEKACEFLRRFEQAHEFAPGTLRFPTAAEYAALAGNVTPGRDTTNLLPYSRGFALASGSLQPDAFGLYDIVGNVAEFAWPEPGAALATEGVECVGGHYEISQNRFDPESRQVSKPSSNSRHVGFRVVYDPARQDRSLELTER